MSPDPAVSLDLLATPVAWADADGRLLGGNPAFASWLGISPRRLPGLPLVALEVEGESLARLLDGPSDRDFRAPTRRDSPTCRSRAAATAG